MIGSGPSPYPPGPQSDRPPHIPWSVPIANFIRAMGQAVKDIGDQVDGRSVLMDAIAEAIDERELTDAGNLLHQATMLYGNTDPDVVYYRAILERLKDGDR